MDVGNFNTRGELGHWLRDKPNDWAHVVATRAALRAFPLLNSASGDWLNRFASIAIRALAISWNALSVPAIQLESDVFRTVAAKADATLRNAKESVSTQMAVDAIYLAALTAHSKSRSNAAQAAKSAAEAIAGFVYDEPPDLGHPQFIGNDRQQSAIIDAWTRVASDCARLSWEDETYQAARRLTKRALWSHNFAWEWKQNWDGLSSRLLTIDPNYSVWIDWYERRIRGERAAFDIPGDKGRVEDKKILRKLAEATDEDFWGKGHEYVNATLKGWLDEARERVAPQPSIAEGHDRPITETPPIILPPQKIGFPWDEEIAALLQKQASPQAQIIDGKLDAVPNAVFDKPQYSNNLADLPSELLAFTEVILNSLPRNCQPVVRNCFAGFRDEMLVRGNRPIVNIVKAMAASLTAELYDAPDQSTSPDEWQLKDPREWGAGMDSMFASFFKGYHDLIHHFPLDSEREELIASTPVDEVAASGTALTGPVDDVAALIVELGKQGFATDNIVRIIEAHAIYNRDVSQLPTPDQPSDVVTPKRRHILQTAGFYLNTYSVIGSTASLYALQTVPAFQQLVLKLGEAADKFLAFIR